MSQIAGRRVVAPIPEQKSNTGLIIGIVIAIIVLIAIIVVIILLLRRSSNQNNNGGNGPGTQPPTGGGPGLVCGTPVITFTGFTPSLGTSNLLEGVFTNFEWGLVVGATSYTIQVSNDINFGTIRETIQVPLVDAGTISIGPYITYDMETGNTNLRRYFYRIKSNGCSGGDSIYSTPLEVNPELPDTGEWQIIPGSDYSTTPAINDPYVVSSGQNDLPVYIVNSDGGVGSTWFNSCAGTICQSEPIKSLNCGCRFLWDKDLRRFFTINDFLNQGPLSFQISDGTGIFPAGYLLNKIDPGASLTTRFLYNSERKKFYIFSDTPYYGSNGTLTSPGYMSGLPTSTSNPPNVLTLIQESVDTHTWNLIYQDPL